MYSEIKQQFKEVIRYSQGIQDPQVDRLFEQWERVKQKFIDRFGGLIYEWPEQVEFTLDSNEKRSRAMEFANSVSDTYNNPVLAEFIDENLDTFFENKVSRSLGEKIPEGMKLVKAFKFFESNKTTLRSIQDAASQLIQENKIKGTLCFSVHPLDFLSSSENTYHWRSCHALDGEYRAGNLSYMVDRTTFMVYLKGADGQYYGGFGPVQWNSKKWRMLIHASENDELMFAGRQYPFSSKSGIDIVLNIYNNLMVEEQNRKNHRWWSPDKYGPWCNNYVDTYMDNGVEYRLSSYYIVFKGFLLNLHDIVTNGQGALNYNDVLRSTCYSYPYYAILNPDAYYSNPQDMANHPIQVGGEVYCLHCGQTPICNSETMRCDDCELEYGSEENDTYGSCACCGARIYMDDAIVVESTGEYICDSCYDSNCFICHNCGEVFYNLEKIFIPDGEDDGHWYCHDCAEDCKER